MNADIDRLRERLAQIAIELSEMASSPGRSALEAEQAALRGQVRTAFASSAEGRTMIEEELATLERRLAELEGQQIKKAKISLGGGGPSGGGLEPKDVYYLRRVHEKWNDVPALRARIEELRSRLEI